MAQEGKIVRNKRTGELGIVQGGVVVPYNQQQGSGAVFMPNPTAAYEPQQAAANVNKTQTDIVDTAEDNRRADTQLEAVCERLTRRFACLRPCAGRRPRWAEAAAIPAPENLPR